MKIIVKQSSAPARFAAEELARYVYLMMGGSLPVVEYDANAVVDQEETIVLGLLSDFSLDQSEVKDAVIEDLIDIRVEDGKGYIAGSNPRSILMGVYQYLKSAGCMWVRPGIEGEYIPKKDISHHTYIYRKLADYPFRGECTEGAISYESLRDMVYWLPKVGMNMLMNEGRVPYLYMHKWYAHISNTMLREPGYVADYQSMAQYIDRCELDLQKTGVQYHNMGHGWLFEEFGVENGYSHTTSVEFTEEDLQHFALFSWTGKRGIAHNSLLYTNLCYSNPETRKKLVNFWVKYAKEKPYVDYFHVWLGDSPWSGCICDECSKKEFSDWYVMLLNEIDEALTAEGITARFVLILYCYTVRPPREIKIKNPDRFLLLYASAIDYGEGYKVVPFEGEEPPYDPKEAVRPGNNQGLAAKWLADWKDFSGAKLSCMYEYRFWVDHFADPGYMRVARETHRDMKALHDLTYDGCMSDLTVRAFMPTGLPLSIMGETLFDENLDFEAYTKDYFAAAFGEDAEACRDYLETITELFNPILLRKDINVAVNHDAAGLADKTEYEDGWFNNPKMAENLAKVPAVVEAFKPIIDKNRKGSELCRVKSWEILNYHAYIITELSKAYLEGAKGDKEAGGEIYLKLLDWLSMHEMEIAPYFDLFLFDEYTSKKFGLPVREPNHGL